MKQHNNVKVLAASRVRGSICPGKRMNLRNLLVSQRHMVVTQHVYETADKISARERIKSLLFRGLRVSSEDARAVHGLARLKMCGESRLDGAPALNVASDECSELTHIIG